MKKFLSVLLMLAMVLGLCACGGNGETATTEPEAPKGLQIGYARESIMPVGQVNISGSGNQEHRVSTGYLDILYATCIAITEGDNTVLLFSTDTLTAKANWTGEARRQISTATGVPQENIQIAGTHTHSGPAVGGSEPLVLEWMPIYMEALVTAATTAMEDRAPATLYGAKVKTEDMNFVRHYLMQDGSYAGSNFGDFNRGIVDHATEGDPYMTLVKADREGDKKDIMIMNFQAHPCFASGTNYNELSADYIGNTRSHFENATGMHFIYFLGATGDQNTGSKIQGEGQPHIQGQDTYGKQLAQYAIDALPNMEKIEGSGVKTTQEKYIYNCNKYAQDRLVDAKKVTAIFDATGSSSQANVLAKELGFWSVYECRGIVAGAGRPEKDSMELNACSFGGVGFVAASYEMFSKSGMYIKENSPYEYTIISTVTNGYKNYYPSEEAFAYGCYESYTAIFATGVAEACAAKFVEMLKAVQ